jgi:predicted SnoaL-like aldol condensation-catalyzing enzyme
MKFMDIWRVVNGKMVEYWVRFDTDSLAQQLGVPRPKYARQ